MANADVVVRAGDLGGKIPRKIWMYRLRKVVKKMSGAHERFTIIPYGV